MPTILAFTTPQVVRLTGVSYRQLAYWETSGVYRASYVDDVAGRPYRRIFSFDDVVNLKALGVLRNQQNVSLDELRATGAYLRDVTDRPWSRKFWVLDGRVMFADPSDHGSVRHHSGQRALVVDLDQLQAQIEQETQGWTERSGADVGQITRHRHVQHNKWVVQGTRIPISTIWDFHQAGDSFAEIVRQFPDLTPDDVRVAIEREESLRKIDGAA